MPLDLSSSVKPSERQELLAMVKRCLEVAAEQADAITALALTFAHPVAPKAFASAEPYRPRGTFL